MDHIYDLNLVKLSIVIACLASYTALDLMAHMQIARGKVFWIWLFCGALAMGSGIWSMHFVGMLALHLQVPWGYNLPITLLSLVIAVVISGCALWLMRFSLLSKSMTAAGSVLMGMGISAMHYTGMAAMQMSPPIDYDPLLVYFSIIIAILASYLAIHTATRGQNKNSSIAVLSKFLSAAELGGAISAMHYIGMAAARFAPHSVSLAEDSAGLDNLALAAIVALVTFLVLMMTLATAAFDSHSSVMNAKLASSLQAANEKLQNIAFYDNLTGLPSRQLLEDRLNLAVHRAERSRKLFACLLIDLNKFKPVNDTYGHLIGDKLLIAVAHRLLDCIRKEDTAARLGGDEFVLVLNEIELAEDAGVIGEKILDSIQRVFHVDGHELSISCSIGISIYPRDGTSPETLIGKADKAMYHAKQKGGYVCFNSEMT
ncbi:MAG: MHYT domain-containing protein [Gammaproteobacteria bacterium]